MAVMPGWRPERSEDRPPLAGRLIGLGLVLLLFGIGLRIAVNAVLDVLPVALPLAALLLIGQVLLGRGRRR